MTLLLKVSKNGERLDEMGRSSVRRRHISASKDLEFFADSSPSSKENKTA